MRLSRDSVYTINSMLSRSKNVCKEEITEILNYIFLISGYQHEVRIDDLQRLRVLERDARAET